MKYLKELFLYFNQIEIIPVDTFDDLSSLEKLRLGKLHSVLLRQIKNLFRIYPNEKPSTKEHFKTSFDFLDGNMIQSVSYEIFQNLKNLKVLGLNENQIEMIAATTFRHLESVEEIYLSR